MARGSCRRPADPATRPAEAQRVPRRALPRSDGPPAGHAAPHAPSTPPARGSRCIEGLRLVCSRARRRGRRLGQRRAALAHDARRDRRPSAGGAMGRAGPRRQSGPVATTSQPGTGTRRAPASGVAGSAGRDSDPRPNLPSRHTEHAHNDEGRRQNAPTPFGDFTCNWTRCGPRATYQGRWDQSGVARGGGPVWIPLDGSSLSDLAAGHLQGPARTGTTYTDHLLSLVIEKVAPTDDVP